MGSERQSGLESNCLFPHLFAMLKAYSEPCGSANRRSTYPWTTPNMNADLRRRTDEVVNRLTQLRDSL